MLSVQPNMQHNMQLPDELAALFARNLTFNPELHQASIPREAPRQEPSPPAAPAQPIVYSISQHYHHSAHIARPPVPSAQDEAPRRSSAPSQTGEMLNAEAILRQHGVDPAGLTPSQLQLFRVAEQPQQLRLLELWSICPPSNGRDIPSLAWSSTTVEQEEQLAQMRYERQQQNQVMSLDGTPVQTNDGRWQHSSDSEPYMLSGYEELMRREQERQERESRPRQAYSHFGSAVGGSCYSAATDPVYRGPDCNRDQQQMAMANQYGAFEQQRSAGPSDSMDMMM
ncbi:hypothetical protein B0I35DRAFT_23070 [Stachybotrys elegans]|uniref:Uncharacterized protein n=1 Tax=Stachybotrys elegans TaxID=80388 RepID=A0A8K0T2E2_9HYPO|nr:hypothetical protein B0I35DRAFT_23070 [Stachybotrys elegans]